MEQNPRTPSLSIYQKNKEKEKKFPSRIRCDETKKKEEEKTYLDNHILLFQLAMILKGRVGGAKERCL